MVCGLRNASHSDCHPNRTYGLVTPTRKLQDQLVWNLEVFCFNADQSIIDNPQCLETAVLARRANVERAPSVHRRVHASRVDIWATQCTLSPLAVYRANDSSSGRRTL
jgi:hypothetical protein